MVFLICTGSSLIITLVAARAFIHYEKTTRINEMMENMYKEHVVLRAPKLFLWCGFSVVLLFSQFILIQVPGWMPSWMSGTLDSGSYALLGIPMLMEVGFMLESQFGRVDIFRHEDYFCIRTLLSVGTIPLKTYKVYYSDCISYKTSTTEEVLLKTKGHIFHIDGSYSNINALHDMLRQHGVKELEKLK